MGSIYDAFFFIQFLGAVAIFFVKFHNVMNGGKMYDIKGGLMLFTLYYICHFLGNIIVIQKGVIDPSYNTLIYGTLHGLESWLLVVVMLFTVFEIFYWWKETAMNPFKRSDGE